MKHSLFFDQVETLMEYQQFKLEESVENKSSYFWLSHRKMQTINLLSANDEYLIRQALTKVSIDQQNKIIKKVLLWLEEHPYTSYQKIPEICLGFLNNKIICDSMNEMNVTRTTSFRNMIKRRFSRISSKVAPEIEEDYELKPKRSVTFNLVPTVYTIS